MGFPIPTIKNGLYGTMKEPISPKVEVYTEPPELNRSKSAIWVERDDFYCAPVSPKSRGEKGKKGKKAAKKKKPILSLREGIATEKNPPYLILGFDTEFKSPGYSVDRDDIKEGRAKFQVLSYQFHAKSFDGSEWSGICCPEQGERMSLGEFLVFALGLGARTHNLKNLPTTIYLVGHFTRADIPAFSDFRNQFDYLSSVRSTFISIDCAIPVTLDFKRKKTVELKVLIRDTMLLTPQASKSLKGIGELVGIPKLTLHNDPKEHLRLIEQMDYVREHHWELFKRYAINDALICVRYIEQIIERYESTTGKKKVPVTLTSIGVDLLMRSWKDDLNIDPLVILGKEKVTEKFYDKKLGYFRKKTREVDLSVVHLHKEYGGESYHGGRNEQFWFGPCFEDHWFDYDLSSAYPTAMSLIGMPQWNKIRSTKNVKDFKPETLGFAMVDFEFPEGTRYPTIPVRTPNGLVFPLSGQGFCASPEIVVALNLGAKLKVHHGIIFPTDNRIKVFGVFIKKCLELRKQAGSKTLTGLFWKEISNSTYGKTAQGLMKKRVYDMREQDTKVLPPSRITNPFFASYITSYVRGLLGEIINALPENTCVFSCTTDGFITNATKSQIWKAQQGPLAKLFAVARKELTDDPRVLETKHELRMPLGWRTRGQATLKTGESKENGEDYNYVLAKGGIFTPAQYETDPQQNDYIVKLFFERRPDTILNIEAFTGIRDIVENDADLVEKTISKRLNMEYDWKRRPFGLKDSSRYRHLVFSTQPWHSVEQFLKIRNSWDDFSRNNPVCLKTAEDFNEFAT